MQVHKNFISNLINWLARYNRVRLKMLKSINKINPFNQTYSWKTWLRSFVNFKRLYQVDWLPKYLDWTRNWPYSEQTECLSNNKINIILRKWLLSGMDKLAQITRGFLLLLMEAEVPKIHQLWKSIVTCGK